MKKIKQLIAVLLLCIGAATISAQEVNTMYFLYDSPTRHYLNPAFAPTSDGYLLLPAIGAMNFGFMNNSLTLQDLIYKNTKGQTATALSPYATADGNGAKQLFNSMRNNMILNTDANINVLSFGFRNNRTYVHIFVNARFDSYFGIKKDIFGLILNGGMKDLDGNNIYNLKTRFDGKLYAEGGFGVSNEINDQWSWGFKVKYLYGLAHFGAYSNNLTATLSSKQWIIDGTGGILASGPFGYSTAQGMKEAQPFVNNGDGLKFQFQPFNQQYFLPKGHGGAIDLGVSYKPIEELTISLAVADLGLIYWNKGYKYDATLNATYDGVGKFNYSDYLDTDENGSRYFNAGRLVDTIKTNLNELKDKAVTTNSDPTRGYWDMITAKLNAGIDANFFNNQLSFGLFSQTRFYQSNVYEELTFGLAYHPRSWFNIAASYSFLNGRWSNLGAGLILRLGPFGITVAADYIPLVYTEKVKFQENTQRGYSLPYNTKGVNLSFGLSLQFGYRQDRDRDRVLDRNDMCPNTPRRVKVDKHGCPLDSDGDGVPDYKDNCPNTPESAFGLVDGEGCPLDSDEDGVPDYKDRCPNTSAGLTVDSTGCPLDSDGDGVPDHLDKCPDTAPNVAVGEDGCSLDSDGDGVPDADDLCPGTPAEAYSTVDEHGCPSDKDNDGVPDYADKCPNTPIEATEKQKNEGMRYIDNHGCEIDTDGDGIPDWKDNCITQPGPDFNNGCPGLSQEVRRTFQQALNGIEFETGSAIIKPSSYPILNKVADLILQNKDWNVEIQGHTDSSGKEDDNQRLSQQRAQSVKAYLISKGVDGNQLTATGFGSSKPIASNSTAAGRAKNRRVVFNVTFEEVSYETVY